MFYETLSVGIVLALFYVELTGVYPGGIIVPAYFALFLDRPLPLAATLAVSLACLGVYRGMSRFFILFGRRRFVVLLLLGVLISQLLTLLLPRLLPSAGGLRVIGWIVPGLLANNLEKQKALPTLASLLAVSSIVYALISIWSWITG
jgi:poly-gamma-glutamate biosynthesis protein PgsC/CapC